MDKILLLYSFTGCDTTSRILGVGKEKLLKLASSLPMEVVSVFLSQTSTKEEVKHAGEKVFGFHDNSKNNCLRVL